MTYPGPVGPAGLPLGNYPGPVGPAGLPLGHTPPVGPAGLPLGYVPPVGPAGLPLGYVPPVGPAGVPLAQTYVTPTLPGHPGRQVVAAPVAQTYSGARVHSSNAGLAASRPPLVSQPVRAPYVPRHAAQAAPIHAASPYAVDQAWRAKMNRQTWTDIGMGIFVCLVILGLGALAVFFELKQ
jgi:hypothetical protein